MQKTCGACHPGQVREITATEHFTLQKSTNLLRSTFGTPETLKSFQDTPRHETIKTAGQLADDLLRRRCFRCHLFSTGDNYPSVSHGTGCASCHLPYYEGKPRTHEFTTPKDEQCLSCHYGNYVGFDYYGRFEHDLNVEYRTPYTTKADYFRPYGVEYHQLQPDIHQKSGMMCIDCHSGAELMTPRGTKIQCIDCHDSKRLADREQKNIVREGSNYLIILHSGEKITLPLLTDPAHFNLMTPTNCQACHAQWSFQDVTKHYLRKDTEDFESWSRLAVQSSFEVERLVSNNSDPSLEEFPLEMSDKISGRMEPGLWLKGYTFRRWEKVMLGRDENGRLTTVRPLLDIRLSWIDSENRVHFDSVGPVGNIRQLRPYVPHTTGHAGLFFENRIDAFLRQEIQSTTKNNGVRHSITHTAN